MVSVDVKQNFIILRGQRQRIKEALTRVGAIHAHEKEFSAVHDTMHRREHLDWSWFKPHEKEFSAGHDTTQCKAGGLLGLICLETMTGDHD